MDTSQPNLTQQLILSKEYPRIDMVEHKHLPIIVAKIKQAEGLLRVDEIGKYVTIRMVMLGGIMRNKVISESDAIPCSSRDSNSSVIKDDDLSDVEKAYKDNALCFNTSSTSMYIKGNTFTPQVKQVYLLILPCSLKEGCASMDEMLMAQLFFVRYKLSTDLSNKEKPFSYQSFGDDLYELNNQHQQRIKVKFENIYLKDKKGMWWPEKQWPMMSKISSMSNYLGNRDPN